MSGGPYVFLILTWSISTIVPMYGDMGAVISSQSYPALAPEHNALTRFFVDLYGWDRFITAAIVANVCALAWLTWSALRPQMRMRVGHTPV